MIHIWLLFGLAACRFLETALALPDDAAQYTLLSQGHYKHELTAVTDELKEAEIIPTVIDEFLPSLLLDVNWSSSDSASLGNTLKPKKLQDEPSITLTRPPTPRDVCYSATNVTYTVTVTDPDAPSRHDPKWSEFLHWIATGLVVSDTTGSSCLSRHTLSLTDLKDLVPYHPPSPPKKTGKHRYVFLVFAPENSTTEPLHLTKPDDRKHWGYDYDGERVGVRKWAAENGLVPVAANFVYSQHKKQ